MQVVLESITEFHLIIRLANEFPASLSDGIHGGNQKKGRVASVSLESVRHVHVSFYAIAGLLMVLGIIPYSEEYQRVDRAVTCKTNAGQE
jgi:hypothetical protein